MTSDEGQRDMTPKGFTREQMKDIYLKVEMSRMLVKMGRDMTKEIEDDLKFYRSINNDL